MTDERPVYLRIADDLRAKIVAGEVADGERLPSIPALQRDYGVASKTAAEALKVLIQEGLATAKTGSGTFVRRRPELQRLIRAWYRATPHGSPFKADMARQGRHATWSYKSRTMVAAPDIRERLALGGPGSKPDVVHTEYVFRADDAPVMLSSSWEPLDITRGTPVVLPEDGMLAGRGVAERMLAIGVVIDDWVEEVGARAGSSEECQALGQATGSIMMTIKRTYYMGERPVETADIVVPADRFSLVYSGKMGQVPVRKKPTR